MMYCFFDWMAFSEYENRTLKQLDNDDHEHIDSNKSGNNTNNLRQVVSAEKHGAEIMSVVAYGMVFVVANVDL